MLSTVIERESGEEEGMRRLPCCSLGCSNRKRLTKRKEENKNEVFVFCWLRCEASVKWKKR